MAFAYYKKLNRRQQRIYRRSDDVTAVRLSNAAALRPLIRDLEAALGDEDQRATQAACRKLLRGMCMGLKVRNVQITVLARRPHDEWEELHGCYQPATDGRYAAITVWMRTARRNQVVAFRSFLRTVLHEFCHHLDYVLLGLADSFHTEGFYKRESSLFHQLVTKKD